MVTIWKAFNYILKRWASFELLVEDGRVCLSNNAAEPGLRGIALGRKSWLFCGSDRGGRRASAMYSLNIRPSGSSARRTSALELDACISTLRSSCMTMHVNKVHHVTTITQVTNDLGEDEDWPWDIANEMEIEDGIIWVYGVGEDGVQAYTDFGLENLIELIRFYKENPGLLGW